ncbi:MAG: FtsQ-type POTRA domain-containing protein [Desulfobacterales bacterium]|nr:FtsQ-type POTRA domain-containing protein [Desulfobacterales bacterium]
MRMFGRKRKIRRNTYKAGVRQRRRNRHTRLRRTAISLGGLGLFVVFNLALILAHDWLTQTALLPIEAVQVDGAERLTEADVLRRAGIAPDDNILAVNLGAARRRLLAHPWIADASVIRAIPDRIVVRIREHDCRAILNLDRQLLISAAGEIFKVRQADECTEAPVISGIDYADLGGADEAPGPALTAALKLLAPGKAAAVIGDRAHIREIRADPELGLTLFVTNTAGVPTYRTIILGFAHGPEKYRKMTAIRSYLDRRGLMPGAQIFNLRDPDRVVISPAARQAGAAPTKEV